MRGGGALNNAPSMPYMTTIKIEKQNKPSDESRRTILNTINSRTSSQSHKWSYFNKMHTAKQDDTYDSSIDSGNVSVIVFGPNKMMNKR